MKPVTVFLIMIGVGVVGFFGGMKYQESVSQTARQMGFGSGGMRTVGTRTSGQQNRMGIRPINGEILSADDDSVTVKTQDGGSKIVLYTEKTTINKASVGEKSDIKSGEKVMIIGTENADGSMTAQSIQLNPILNQNRMVK
ncbi:MAG: hypothetical protein WAV30_01530 [Microgenomates group bacterium]